MQPFLKASSVSVSVSASLPLYPSNNNRRHRRHQYYLHHHNHHHLLLFVPIVSSIFLNHIQMAIEEDRCPVLNHSRLKPPPAPRNERQQNPPFRRECPDLIHLTPIVSSSSFSFSSNSYFSSISFIASSYSTNSTILYPSPTSSMQ